MHDLLQIQVVGSKSDWFLLGLDKYGTVWSGTARPVGATFELDWVQINEKSRRRSSWIGVFIHRCFPATLPRPTSSNASNPVRRRDVLEYESCGISV